MRAINDYHAALAEYLRVTSTKQEGAETEGEAVQQARWNVERLFKEAVGEAMNDALRGRF